MQHTAGSGLYRIDFPAGTFTGNAGKFLIATVTPIGPSTSVDFASSIAPIAADGSGSFEVQFAGGETLFDYTVAVSITSSSAGEHGLQRLGQPERLAAGVGLHGAAHRRQRPVPDRLPGRNVRRQRRQVPDRNRDADRQPPPPSNFASSIAPIAADGSGSFEVQFSGRRDAVRLRRRRLDQLTRAPCLGARSALRAFAAFTAAVSVSMSYAP